MKIFYVMVLASVLLLSGCAHIRYKNTTGKPISFTSKLGTTRSYRVTSRVDDSYKRWWLLWGLVPISKDGSGMIRKSARGGDGMVNLQIRAEWSFLDLIISAFTGGLVMTRSVDIEGNLIAFEGGASPPKVEAGGSKCAACNASMPPAAKHCPSCGKKQAAAAFCSKCGAKAKADAKFCAKCGNKVGP